MNSASLPSQQMLTIKEVSRRLKVSNYTLRFWEKELEGILVPLRTRGGQRRYTIEHLFIIREIKRLKKKGHSLSNIKHILGNSQNVEWSNSNSRSIDILANQVAEIVRSSIYRFFETEK